MANKTVEEARRSPDQHISDRESQHFVGGNDVIVAAARVDPLSNGTPPNESDYYAIGLIQGFSLGDARGAPEQGELGSDATIVMITDSAKTARFDRLMIKGKSLLYAAYYPEYGIKKNNHFKPIVAATGVNIEEYIEKEYGADDLIGGEDILMAVAPKTDMEADPSQPLSLDSLNSIALVQGFQLGSNSPVVQVPELGTNAKYNLASKGGKSITLTRIMTDDSNVLRAFYKEIIEEQGLGSRVIWNDLDHSIFKNTIYPVLIFLDKNGEIDSAAMLRKAIPTNIGMQAVSGNKGMAENLTFSWNKTQYYMGVLGGGRNDAPGDLANTNIWLDLDRNAFRQPINLMLLYLGADAVIPNERKVVAKQILHKVLIDNLGRTITAGGKTTVEGASISWERTENQHI